MILNQTREITDKFTVEVEMDRRCYEELLDERKNMELTYEERIAQLQDQHAEVRKGVRICFCFFLFVSHLPLLATAIVLKIALAYNSSPSKLKSPLSCQPKSDSPTVTSGLCRLATVSVWLGLRRGTCFVESLLCIYLSITDTELPRSHTHGLASHRGQIFMTLNKTLLSFQTFYLKGFLE